MSETSAVIRPHLLLHYFLLDFRDAMSRYS